MKEIKQVDLKKIGIDLPKGKYKIKTVKDGYDVFSVKDDTLGCILVGQNKVKGGLVDSASCEIRLIEKLKDVKDDIWLRIVE